MSADVVGPAEGVVDPHDPDERAAMGLPHQIVTRLPDDGREHADTLLRRTPDELAHLVEDGDAPRSLRYFAGQLLAIVGDPRIDPDDPVMTDLPATEVEIGLTPSDVDQVVHDWAHRGVERDWVLKECPRHTVTLRGCRLMKYQVTNAEFLRFARDTKHWPAPTSWVFGAYPHERSNHPVWSVDAADVDAYAGWLSRRLGRRFRLPTEAEWEYAAAGVDGRAYPWGESFDPYAVNTVETGPVATTPVGMFPHGFSPFGVADLGGNVEEYVTDDYAPYPGGELITDDLFDGRDHYRITRGGSFSRFGDLTRCRRRHGWYAGRNYYAVGFRLAEDVT